MINEMQRYYESRGLIPGKSCPHRGECKGDSDNIRGPKASFIGSKYGNGNQTKLVFISIAPAGNIKLSKTTPSASDIDAMDLDEVRKWAESESLKDHKYKGRHWGQVYDIAQAIFSEVDNLREISQEETTPFWCHINAAKCNLGGEKDVAEPPPRFYENCRDYLKGEVEMLAPQIIVSHGKTTYRSISNAFNGSIIPQSGIDGYRKINTENFQAHWFAMYHPRAYGRYWAHKKKYLDKFIKLVASLPDHQVIG